ncbi:MAG TPA: ribonuclease Z [Thermodesulfobacteriota bacterium]|nr:ribonuclease Z [Thermodesulfobacteriota bacterium]
MILHILGSGTCVPYERRGSSGYAVKLPKSTILLDCGNGTTWKLGKAGINYLEVDQIFLSHFHPDHTADLIPFLFATRYAFGSPYGSRREKPLSIWGSKGFKDFFSALTNAYNGWIMPDNLMIEELEEGIKRFDDFTLNIRRVPHIESSFAYRIESEGKSLVYSGDTDYSESLIELAKDADILVIECALPGDELKIKGHLTPNEVAKVVNGSTPKKVIITHLYPICDKWNVIDKIKKQVRAEVVLAEDLMKVEM